jgi:pyruvate dehydrogenase E2 component (dihydrolipoamide acetyltransferase)
LAEEINIPKLGMSMKEATLVEWKFSEGDQVNEGDVVLVIETAKTTWEITALASGFLHIAVEAGSKQNVGTVVGLIAATKEELAALQEEGVLATSAEAEVRAAPQAAEGVPAKSAGGARINISPVARRIAEASGVDIASITGTGPGGRITKKDVEDAIEAGRAVPAAAAGVAVHAAPSSTAERDGKKIKQIVPLRGMRKAIADHMHHSLAVAAQLTRMIDSDVTSLKGFRADLVAMEEALGVRIGYTDIYVLALANTLRDMPVVNSSLVDGEIIIWEDINICVAVALDDADGLGGGLITPVVRNADRKSLTEINREVTDLAQKAREGKLMPDDVSGGTFTLTNMGAASKAWAYGTPIINQPESAVLQTGAIVDRPVVVEGQIVIRPMMTISLTFDHRVIDGLPAARFLERFEERLSNPLSMLV